MRNEWGATVNDKPLETAQEAPAVCEAPRERGVAVRQGLEAVRHPEDLRRLDRSALRRVADELREETIQTVSVTGGHLGASLGVVELTVACIMSSTLRATG